MTQNDPVKGMMAESLTIDLDNREDELRNQSRVLVSKNPTVSKGIDCGSRGHCESVDVKSNSEYIRKQSGKRA